MRFVKNSIILLLANLVLICALNAQDKKNVFLLEAEDFFDIAEWRSTNYENVQCLQGSRGGLIPPITAVNLPEDGDYEVWVSACDYKPQARSRSFKVVINGDESLPVAGTFAAKSGKEGWQWEKLGTMRMQKGSNIVKIVGIGSFMRLDAIVFSKDASLKVSENPKFSKATSRKGYRLPRFNVKETECNVSVEKLSDVENPKIVSIENSKIKVSFTQKKSSDGKFFYERSAEIFDGANWVKLPSFKGEAMLLGWEAQDPEYRDKFFSVWRKPRNYVRVKGEFGESVLPIPTQSPFDFEFVEVLRPLGVKKISDTNVELIYSNYVTATMSLIEDTTAIKMSAKVIAPKAGFYSVAFLGFDDYDRSAFTQLSLPPLFQVKTAMNEFKQVGNRMTSQPIAIIEAKLENGVKYSHALIADPSKFPPDEWSYGGSSKYAFSLCSPFKDKVQLSIFEPVLGARGSKKNKSEVIETTCYILSDIGEWTKLSKFANEKIYAAGKIFREAFTTSFSKALSNMVKALGDEEAGGWSPWLKGRWNIERSLLVTNSVPLTELSIALLTDDENYYKKFALPVIEYSLTRQGFHFLPIKEDGGSYSATPFVLTVPSKQFGADHLKSLNKMLGDSNPWLFDLAKRTTPNKNEPEWTTLLGEYHAYPSEELLAKIKTSCDEWLEGAFYPENTKERFGYTGFVNTKYYPFWWYLNDLYEITKDKKYLDYAYRGAYYSTVSMWNYPTPQEGEIEIYKKGYFVGLRFVWSKGYGPYRLGVKSKDIDITKSFTSPNLPIKLVSNYWIGVYLTDPKKVEALKVSRIGLGIEQPSSYMATNPDNNMNILMPGWAPEILNVYKNTGDDLLLKFSRHAIIGRFGTYPGYYICDFIDRQHCPDYPFKGPDVTSIYYHHMPCFFAHTADYLFTQLEIASSGKINFPYLRQKGYVWFVDRLFGLAGKVYGESARPLIDAQAITADSTKISTFFAVAEDGVWAFVLNDGNSDISSKISFSKNSKAFANAKTSEPIKAYSADGKFLYETNFDGEKTLDIKRQTLVAFKVPTSKNIVERKSKPLEGNGHYERLEAHKDLGDMHAFRIRSPFGKDSLYVMFTRGVELKDCEVELVVKSPVKQSIKVAKFPYEFSLYPLNQDSDIKFEIIVNKSGLNPTNLGEITLKK